VLDDVANICGIIDWEQALLLPFGMNAWWIRPNAVINRSRIDYIQEMTQPMSEAFFKSLIASAEVPPPLQPIVILSMQTGFVIISTFIEGFPASEPDLNQFVERFDWFEKTFAPLCTGA
jgi:hypothetical protein